MYRYEPHANPCTHSPTNSYSSPQVSYHPSLQHYTHLSSTSFQPHQQPSSYLPQHQMVPLVCLTPSHRLYHQLPTPWSFTVIFFTRKYQWPSGENCSMHCSGFSSSITVCIPAGFSEDVFSRLKFTKSDLVSWLISIVELVCSWCICVDLSQFHLGWLLLAPSYEAMHCFGVSKTDFWVFLLTLAQPDHDHILRLGRDIDRCHHRRNQCSRVSSGCDHLSWRISFVSLKLHVRLFQANHFFPPNRYLTRPRDRSDENIFACSILSLKCKFF